MNDSEKINEFPRRTMLVAAAGLAFAGLGLDAIASEVQDVRQAGQGKPGEFDFLAGEWKISHRQRKATGKDEWDEFTGEATLLDNSWRHW